MDFTAENANDLLNKAKQSFLNKEEEDCYLTIIKHIQKACDQRKNSLDLYIDISPNALGVVPELCMTKSRAVKMKKVLEEKGFRCRFTYLLFVIVLRRYLTITW